MNRNPWIVVLSTDAKSGESAEPYIKQLFRCLSKFDPSSLFPLELCEKWTSRVATIACRELYVGYHEHDYRVISGILRDHEEME